MKPALHCHRARGLLLTAGTVILGVGTVGQGPGLADAADRLQFNRDVRPVLANYCFPCHGPDGASRQGGLRLDDREQATQPAESGATAIVPGDPAASELVRRLFSTDPDLRMPPADAPQQPSDAQRELLQRWVAEDAPYERHWALIAPTRPALPSAQHTTWPRNPIDLFVLARLEQERFAPAREADPITLLRRVTLDLTGLPPSPEDVETFRQQLPAVDRLAGVVAGRELAGRDSAAARSDLDRAYEQAVDRLLASPHFGERLAVDWLDAARFADTNGYQVDRDREMYAWRDWVIAAFNANMPFDQFTLEQFAGDLLPGATAEQRIATGFHRNHMLNEEGGIIPEEFLAEYCADRVETMATVWLGQTFNCARCHDHKFDSFTQRDFYSLYAFFHNVPENGVGNYGASIRRNAPPIIRLPSPELERQLATLQGERDATRQQRAAAAEQRAASQLDWEHRVAAEPVAWHDLELLAVSVDDSVVTLDERAKAVAIPALVAGNHRVVLELRLPAVRATHWRWTSRTEPAAGGEATTSTLHLGQWKAAYLGSAAPDAGQPWPLDGAEHQDSLAADEAAKALSAGDGTAATWAVRSDSTAGAVFGITAPAPNAEPGRLRLEGQLRVGEPTAAMHWQFAVTGADQELVLPARILAVLGKQPGERSPDETKQLAEFWLGRSSEHRRLTARENELARQLEETELQIPTALVLEEMGTPRATYILRRGAYDKPGQAVTADTPLSLPPMAAELPRNRLGLAQWLTDRQNPLPARVTVNRLWQSLFGVGLVRTAENFGTQGEPPAHPELLDWLAVEFVESGWDVKALVRLMVTSATYRQDSHWTRELLERDPDNRLLARGPRFRLPAELVRDQALAASGLLVTRIGGPSVRPYHPPGLYEQVVAGSSASTYVVGRGEELFRRSLYTYWKRSVPNPAMLTFDAPFRETCSVRRPRTNTPLQALNLLNDPTYVEAARLLAERMMREASATEDRATRGFQRVLARAPWPRELAVLVAAYARAFRDFQGDRAAVDGLLAVGTVPRPVDLDAVELAAWTMVASTILNLDEAVTKE